jgi:hypothetical protein
MSASRKICITLGKHGPYQTTAERFDQVMRRYLPASPDGLRATVQARADEMFGAEVIDYSDLETATECLMALAILHGYGTV